MQLIWLDIYSFGATFFQVTVEELLFCAIDRCKFNLVLCNLFVMLIPDIHVVSHFKVMTSSFNTFATLYINKEFYLNFLTSIFTEKQKLVFSFIEDLCISEALHYE